MATYDIYEAERKFSRLVEEATRGQEVVIAKAGEPVARMVPIEKKQAGEKRKFGQNCMGITYIAPDFDEPMREEELGEHAPVRRTLAECIALLPESSTATIDEDFAKDIEAGIAAHREPLMSPAWD